MGAEGRVAELIDLVIGLLGDVRDTNTSLSVRLQNALRTLYGRTSEKISSNQLALLLSASSNAHWIRSTFRSTTPVYGCSIATTRMA